jgi:hypothetical protein
LGLADDVLSGTDAIDAEKGGGYLFPPGVKPSADRQTGLKQGMSFQVQGANPNQGQGQPQGQPLGRAHAYSQGAEPTRPQGNGDSREVTESKSLFPE